MTETQIKRMGSPQKRAHPLYQIVFPPLAARHVFLKELVGR